MLPQSRQGRIPPHAPKGCDGHLTRRQAARALGFASEFKIRQFEREGLLHSVRGPMRTAFYPRAEILALKARLISGETGPIPGSIWTDAELLALLAHPKPDGRTRGALDLVLETQISIERAERIFLFWSKGENLLATRASAARASTEAGATSDAGDSCTSVERRSVNRLSRDALIRELRNPDPRMREEAFARLHESRVGEGTK